MITYTTARTDDDLKGILALQKANLSFNLSTEEIASQGFVTVVHDLDTLRQLNEVEPHIIAKQNGKVVAYLLTMTAASPTAIAVLKPMFEMFNRIELNKRPVSSYRYLVVGQACVDKPFRGQGIFDLCYKTYREIYRSEYDFAITEIAARNTRSINAHKRIGFKEVHCYKAPDAEEWSIVIWEW